MSEVEWYVYEVLGYLLMPIEITYDVLIQYLPSIHHLLRHRRRHMVLHLTWYPT